MPLPQNHQQPKTSAETLESRVSRGDFTAIAATLRGLTLAVDAWAKTVAALPELPIGTPEGAALVGFKASVVPELERLTEMTKALAKEL